MRFACWFRADFEAGGPPETMSRHIFIACAALFAALPIWAQQGIDFDAPQPVAFAEGWQAFTDLKFLGARNWRHPKSTFSAP